MSLLQLPKDNIIMILSYLHHPDIIAIRHVCKDLFNISSNELLWETIDLGIFKTNNLDNIIKLLNNVFRESMKMTKTITITKPMSFTIECFYTLQHICPNIKNITLKTDTGLMLMSPSSNTEKNKIPLEFINILNLWDLESIIFTGNSIVIAKQDYFKKIFIKQKNLKYFRCDFIVSPVEPVVLPNIYETILVDASSMVSQLLQYCDNVEVIKIPNSTIRNYMQDEFYGINNENIKEITMRVSPFLTSEIASNFATKLNNLENLHIIVSSYSWTDTLEHLEPFINSLQNIRSLVVDISSNGLFDTSNLHIKSNTLRTITFSSTDNNVYSTTTLGNLKFNCPELENIEISNIDIDDIELEYTPSIKSLEIVKSVMKNFNKDIIIKKYPNIKIINDRYCFGVCR